MAISKCASIPATPLSRWRTWTLRPPNVYPSSSLTGYRQQSRISPPRKPHARPLPLPDPSVRPPSPKRPRPTPIMKRPIERIPLHNPVHPGPIHPPSKHQHIPRLRLHHQMLHIYSPFHPTRLIRPLEVPFNRRSCLLQIQVLRRSLSIRILAIQSPLPRGIRRHLLRRRSLPQRHSGHHHSQNQTKHKIAQPKSLHRILRHFRIPNSLQKSRPLSHPAPR